MSSSRAQPPWSATTARSLVWHRCGRTRSTGSSKSVMAYSSTPKPADIQRWCSPLPRRRFLRLAKRPTARRATRCDSSDGLQELAFDLSEEGLGQAIELSRRELDPVAEVQLDDG